MKRIASVALAAWLLVACKSFGDASDSSSAAGSGFCAAHKGGATVFCDDFDQAERTAVVSGWSAVYRYPTGALTTDLTTSSPRAACFTFDGTSDRGRGGVSRDFRFPSSAKALTLRARVDAKAGYDNTVLGMAYGDCSIDLKASGGLDLTCYPDYSGAFEPPSLPRDTFAAVAMRLERTSGGILVRVTVDDVANENTFTDPALAPTESMAVSLGNFSNDHVGTVCVDDVLVEIE